MSGRRRSDPNGAIVDNDPADREAPNLRERAYERFTRRLLARDIKPGQFISHVVQAEAIDWNFHATIIDGLGNAIISEAYRVNAIKIRLIKQSQTRLNEAVLVPTMREYLGIIDVLRRRDPSAAMDAMGSHILNARSRAMDLR